ncbi:hypothetical protein CSPX01_05081 [Colletotrichum filicis]|nr:hypothetical protein CSPX01_05081 [Colletotrichum filicis]
MAGRLARIQARGNAEAILTAAGVSLLQDHGTAAAGYPDTLRIRPTGMGWMVGWCRSDPVNAVNIYVLYKPPPWLASLGSRLARLPGHGGYLWPLVMGFGKPKCHCAWKTWAAATLKISIPRARDFMFRLRLHHCPWPLSQVWLLACRLPRSQVLPHTLDYPPVVCSILFHLGPGTNSTVPLSLPPALHRTAENRQPLQA